MDVRIESSWKALLKDEFDKPYFVRLAHAVRQEYSQHTCYPPGSLIFNAFNSCPLDRVKVVILGQDPYHEPGQAHGLCFSVNDGEQPPPSLVNIYKEIHDEFGTPLPHSGNLERWSRQGILLLNSTLTVRARQANSHSHLGWSTFTDEVIRLVSEHTSATVFMLWGRYARSKTHLIDSRRHCILQAVHPSPLSANRGGWFGNGHFRKCNEWLQQHGKTPIAW